MPSLDLLLLPLYRQAGRDQAQLPGLFIPETPRRIARSRKGDQLMLYFSMVGNSPLSPGKEEQLLASLSKTYFETSGSVTAALRTVAETMNRFLLDRNVQSASTGRQGIGLLTLLAVRGGRIYLAQSGPVHAYILAGEQSEYLYDPQLSGRGLGLSRMTPVRYAQAELRADDIVLLAVEPAPTWTLTTLASLKKQGPESLRRHLSGRAAINLNAVLILAKPGAGKLLVQAAPEAEPVSTQVVPAGPPVEISRPEVVMTPEAGPAAEEMQPPEEVPAPAVEPAVDAGPEPVESSEEQTGISIGPEAAEDLEFPGEAGAPTGQGHELENKETLISSAVAVQAVPQAAADPTAGAGLSVEKPQGKAKPAVRRPQMPRPKLNIAIVGQVLMALIRPLALLFVLVGRGIKTLFGRMLPESLLALPSTTMAFIAIAVPVVVVAMASYTYFQLGSAAQYEALFAQAEQMAVEAASQTDVVARRENWEATLAYLDQADRVLGGQEESRLLRQEIRQALDELNLVRRAGFQPAIVNGLPETVNVKRIRIVDNDLYLLDANSGNALRALITSRGYQLDPAFQCGPTAQEGVTVGPLVDLVPWELSGEIDATVVGLDANGNLLYCTPGQSPVAATLTPSPSTSLTNLVAATVDVDDFYLLDPTANAVWIYWNSNFVAQPEFFFGEQVPNMQDVVDLAVSNDELYLLHADGHVTLCTYSALGVAPTRCSDPPYIDFRPGLENTPLVPANPFAQLLYAPPPDPSLYLLEPGRQAIYRFSLRNLAFQHQYLPAGGVAPGPATAFAVNQVDRTFFLAVGNDVYYANIP